MICKLHHPILAALTALAAFLIILVMACCVVSGKPVPKIEKERPK